MDMESRLSRVEATLEMHQRDIQRLYEAISELRKLMLERFDQIDQRFIEERKYTDQRINELQAQFTAQFSEMRREASVNMRWMVGMWLSTMGMIMGLAGRVFGIY